MIRFEIADNDVTMDMPDNSATMEVEAAVFVRPNAAYYTGSYDVTPMVDAQSLATKEKFLTDDVRIHAIPYFEVGNTSGGSTVYIGTLEELVGTAAILGTAKLGVMTL